MTAGSCIFAVGLNGVLIPKELLSGGLVGVALILHYLFPALNTGLLYFLLNIPLLLLGWFSVSRRFILYTAYGMTAFSLAAGLIQPGVLQIQDPILAAILSGVICGFGAGITLRSQGSGGGMDIVAVYLNKKWEFRMGVTFFLTNALVLAAGAFFLDVDKTLYSLVFVYTSGKVVDSVLTGFNQRKSILIITDHPDMVAERIISDLNRGVTFLHGSGGYTGEHKEVILSIITLTELARMKELIFDVDPHAFVVINDTLEVLGKRHGTRRVY